MPSLAVVLDFVVVPTPRANDPPLPAVIVNLAPSVPSAPPFAPAARVVHWAIGVGIAAQTDINTIVDITEIKNLILFLNVFIIFSFPSLCC